MEQKIPFTSYDFWAYLSAGFLLLFVIDYVGGTGVFARESWTVIQGIVAVSSAYVVGQLTASLSSLLLERLLVGRLLGYPRMILFGKATAWRVFRALLPMYYQALPRETQEAALNQGKKFGIDKPGEALFWPAYAHARATPAVMSRLENFLNLYGFCRNIAVVGLIDSALLAISHRWYSAPAETMYLAVALLILSLGMILRYLKFYRQFAIEAFTAFAYAEDRIGDEK